MAHQAFEALITALAQTAAEWADPEYPLRAEAVAQTLDAPNRFTEEAVAFAVNQQMSLLTPEALRSWIATRRTEAPQMVGVIHPGTVPCAAFRDFLAVVLTGHRYLGAISPGSPYLLPAFVDAVRTKGAALEAAFAPIDEVFSQAEAILFTASDERSLEWAAARSTASGISPERQLVRIRRYSVAVLDGHETDDALEGLAEDALLYEGYGSRSVVLIWAPDALAPDAFLQALAHFRSVFPVHPEVPGALEMQRAFLEATGQPHAYGEGLEFLVSKGLPEVQPPGHLRWVGYEQLDEVATWLDAQVSQLQHAVACPGVAKRLPNHVPLDPPGEAHRPRLDWDPDGQDTVAFLTGL